MGKIISLQDGIYKYELPAMPTKEEDILFFDKPKKDQFWIPPDLSVYRRLSISEKREFVNKIRDYWRNGLWFFNNGEPTYITGLHFDFLSLHTFSTIETHDKRPRFYQSQLDDFYFRDLTWKDPKCFGRVFFKCRRYGCTLQEMAEIYYRATEDFGRQVGVMSNEWTKTLTSIFRPLVSSMMKRPKYMRAEYYKPSNRVPKKELLFSSGIVSEEDENGEYAKECLEGWITPKPTTTAAFDGDKLAYGCFDEAFKWITTSPKETIAVHRKSIEVGGRPVGKLSVLSTVGDSDTYEAAVRDAVEIYHDSDPEVLDANGMTKSGLYRYFISGIYMMNETHADKYGYLDKDLALEEIMNTRAKFQVGTKDYIFECRRVPLSIAEALSSTTFNNIFDKERIEKRLTILRKTPRDKMPYAEGSFEEDNIGIVHWVPDSNGGPWKVAQLPLMNKSVDFSNRWEKDFDGNLQLLPGVEGAIGYDPVRIAVSDASSGTLSNACIIAGQKFDYRGNGGANRYCAMYLHRPEDPDTPTYESYKCAKFYGWPVMIERNVEGARKWYRSTEINASGFMMVGDDGIPGTLIHGRNNAVNNLVDIFQKYIQKPLPISNDIDWLMEIPFERLLLDMKEFNPKKTTLYDAMMANLQLQAALKKIIFTNVLEKGTQRKSGMSALTPKRTIAAP